MMSFFFLQLHLLSTYIGSGLGQLGDPDAVHSISIYTSSTAGS